MPDGIDERKIDEEGTHYDKFVDEGYLEFVGDGTKEKMEVIEPTPEWFNPPYEVTGEPGTESFEVTPTTNLVAENKEPPKATGNDLYFMLRFKSDQALKRIQDYAKEAMDAPGIKWEDPEEFHITLVYVENLTRAMAAELSTLVDTTKPVDLAIDGFGAFSVENGDDSNVLYLEAVKTPELDSLQRNLYTLIIREFPEAKVSFYSEPDGWMPHITLAYGEQPFDFMKLPEVGGVAIGGQQVEAAIDYKTIAVSVSKAEVSDDQT